MGYYNTFIVRIWTDDGLSLSRGHVKHVGTRDCIWFTYLEQMNEFVADHLTPPTRLYQDMDKGVGERRFLYDNTEECGT